MNDFIRIGKFIVPIVVDKSLREDSWYIISQAEVDSWIKNNPEKAQQLLRDVKHSAKRAVNQLYSVSYTVKGDKHD